MRLTVSRERTCQTPPQTGYKLARPVCRRKTGQVPTTIYC